MIRHTTLLDQVAHPRVLLSAFEEVRRSDGAPGVDGVSLEVFAHRLDSSLDQLSRELRGGWYAPLPVRRLFIPKSDGGRRAIGIPAVRDRIVARACQRILSPSLERQFCRNSFAYRKGRSTRGAVERVLSYLRSGGEAVALLDIHDFFPSVHQGLLLGFLEEILQKDPLVPLIGLLMAAGVVEERNRRDTRGIEQGSPLSPLLANVYLHPWDRALTARKARWVRYSDNALIVCSTPEEAAQELALAREDLAKLNLSLNPDKSQVSEARAGFPFLGYHLSSAGLGPDLQAIQRLRTRLVELAKGEARLPAAQRLAAQRIATRRDLLRGWLNYYSNLNGIPVVDGWTLAAALELAEKRKDRAGASGLLRAEVEETVEPEALEAVRARVQALKLPMEPGEEEEVGDAPLIQAMPRPRGMPLNRATAVALSSKPEAPDEAPDEAPEEQADPYRKAELTLRSGQFRQAIGVASHLTRQERAARPTEREVRENADPTQMASRSTEETSRRVSLRGAAPQRQGSGGDAASAGPAPNIRISRMGLSLLMRFFRGNADMHARMRVDTLGRRRYFPIQSPLDEAAWRRHLEGTETLAISLSDGGRLHAAVLDVDIARPVFERVGGDPVLLAGALEATQRYALALMKRAGALGLDARLEDSGQKGRHVWLFFDPPAGPRDVFRLLSRIVERTGPAPEGVSCETIPASSKAQPAGGALVTAPLGIHLESGRRSTFLDGGDELVEDIEAHLRDIHPCSAQGLQAALREEPPTPEPALPIASTDAQVQAILSGCPVAAFLVGKAADIAHLNHRERLTLLCIFGHLGASGVAFLHSVMARCANYDPRITDRYVAQLKPSPVSCSRVREWLPEVTRQVPCCCQFKLPKSAYPSPVLHAVSGTSGGERRGGRG